MTEAPLARLTAALGDRYEIEREIGSGGMATVYLARDLKHLLLIGAYRSNEVDVGHPLRLALNEIELGRAVHELALRPLALASVEQLVADTLACDRAASRELAELLHEQTQGNPFFLNEMLRRMEQVGAIVFSPEAGRWRWHMSAVRRAGLTNNVVDFVVANLRKLAPQTQRVLQLAACIGNTFDLRTLAIIHEQSMDETGEALLPALPETPTVNFSPNPAGPSKLALDARLSCPVLTDPELSMLRL